MHGSPLLAQPLSHTNLTMEENENPILWTCGRVPHRLAARDSEALRKSGPIQPTTKEQWKALLLENIYFHDGLFTDQCKNGQSLFPFNKADAFRAAIPLIAPHLVRKVCLDLAFYSDKDILTIGQWLNRLPFLREIHISNDKVVSAETFYEKTMPALGKLIALFDTIDENSTRPFRKLTVGGIRAYNAHDPHFWEVSDIPEKTFRCCSSLKELHPIH